MKKTESKKRPRTALSLKEPDSDWDSLSDRVDEQAKKTPTRKRVTDAAEETKEPRLIKNKLSKGPTHMLAPKQMHRVILWMRNDLRLHDNPVLNWAA